MNNGLPIVKIQKGETYLFQYDENNKVIKKTVISKGKIQHVMNYNDDWEEKEIVYYPNGLLKEEKGQGCKYEYQYLYDEHDNWIVQTVLENGIAREVFIRDIAYFPNSNK